MDHFGIQRHGGNPVNEIPDSDDEHPFEDIPARGHPGNHPGEVFDSDDDDSQELVHEQRSSRSSNSPGGSTVVSDSDLGAIDDHDPLSDSESAISFDSNQQPYSSEEEDEGAVEQGRSIGYGVIPHLGLEVWMSDSDIMSQASPSASSNSHSPRRSESVDSLFVDQPRGQGLDEIGHDPQRELDVFLHEDLEEVENRGNIDFMEQIHQGMRQIRELEHAMNEHTRRRAEAELARHQRLSTPQRRQQPNSAAHPPRNHNPGARLEISISSPELDSGDDELVEMEVSRRRSSRIRPGRAAPEGEPPRQRTPPAEVIDLTAEPDSPDEVVVLANRNRRGAQPHSRANSNRPSPYPQPAPRNPRRQASFNHRTPSLARSDGSILGAARGAQVIDLTEMDDDDAPIPQRPAPLSPRSFQRAAAQRRQQNRAEMANNGNGNQVNDNSIFGALHSMLGFPPHFPGLPALDIFQRFGGAAQAEEDDVQVIGGRQIPPPVPQAALLDRFRGLHPHHHYQVPQANNNLNFGNNIANPLAANLPNFDYQANGYNNAPAKPPYIPPPAPKPGFTRDTGPDVEAMCPSCEEELSYDPDEEIKSPPTKRLKNRKDNEVHHFWAVKECGHVYCSKCFEGRKPTARRQTTMRLKDGNPKKILCFVDDCDSEVGSKAAWVGIFL